MSIEQAFSTLISELMIANKRLTAARVDVMPLSSEVFDDVIETVRNAIESLQYEYGAFTDVKDGLVTKPLVIKKNKYKQETEK